MIIQVKKLIQNLRRGDEMEYSYEVFKNFVNHIIQSQEIKEISLRDLISIIDTFADHGNDIEKSSALTVSVFFNTLKISDTFLKHSARLINTQPQSNGVFHLYDGVNSLRLAYDDMPSVLFFRIEKELLKSTFVYPIWKEVLIRLKLQSKTLQLASLQNPLFFEPQFFPGRKNFLGLEYPHNKLVKQLDF